jgi:hypothetical protein
MKRSLLPGIIFVILLSVFSAISVLGGKNRLITSADLDHAFTSGSQVFYQLTDEEGGNAFTFYPGTGITYRKVPAVITFNYYDRRDESGRKVYALYILRPAFLGGPFSKDEVAFDSGREPGSCDTIQPGDLRN